MKPFVFLDTIKKDSENRRSLLFKAPVREIQIFSDRDLKALEEALAEGLWVAGYLNYEFGYLLEPRLGPLATGLKGPLGWFGAFEAPEILPPGEIPFWGSEESLGSEESFEISEPEANISLEDYILAINQIKEFVASGDTYQVNFTFKLKFSYWGSPFSLYMRLRRHQPVSYAALIFDGQGHILSLSPELFFRCQDKRIWSRPMKGTAPRGRTLDEDEAISRNLRKDPKNRAENVMIVDLIRNDLSRICQRASVYVPRLFEVERYRTVHQMTSTVLGELGEGGGVAGILRALFPCGSVTGAPKIRTMEIIAELEKEPRGLYTGAIGFFSPRGEACFNVAIRTVFLRDGRGEMGIGSGIVYDSEALSEYQECLLKGRFLVEDLPDFFLIETMLLEEGRIFLLKRHLKRLRASAAYFDFLFEERRLLEDLKVLARSRPRGKHRVRILLAEDGNYRLECTPLKGSSQVFWRFGLAEERVNSRDPFLYHKTTHRSLYDRWRDEASCLGLEEIVFLNERGELTEGTISNIFIEFKGTLYTPPLTSGLLPGTLRAELLEKGLCREKVLYPEDLRRASRIFLGNSVRGLIPAGFVKTIK
ncbi:aminodeoxychorismate synthase component I [Thermosulfuriphilus sp.]